MEYLLIGLVGLLLVGSMVQWCHLVRRTRSGRPLLAYQRRRDVPWNALHLILFLALLLLILDGAKRLAGVDAEVPVAELPIAERTRFALATAAATLVATLGGAVLIVATAGATLRDLGLSCRARRWAGDVRLGTQAFLVSVVPVYAIKLLLYGVAAYAGHQPESHPLVDMVQAEASGKVMAVALFAAVCAAPIFEEFVFRVLLQGWLEKMDRGNWPRGVFPIVTSSGLFALMHVGNGLDPIPLFFFAVVLGYVYHRTHRVLPSVVAHMLLNGFSLGVFWMGLSLEWGGQAG